MNGNPLNEVYANPHSSSNVEMPSSGLPSLSKTCFIQPKSTGLASLFLQFGLLIVSGVTAMFLFYHVGGYEYMQWNENSTILEPIHHNYYPNTVVEDIVIIPSLNETDEDDVVFPTASNAQENDTLVSTVPREIPFSNESANKFKRQSEASKNEPDGVSNFFESLIAGANSTADNATFGIEQVPMTTVRIMNVEFDWLELIRVSTLVYLLISAFWFVSMVFFICTVRCEVFDTAFLNSSILTFVILYQCVHSGLIIALIFLQTEMSWRTLAITIGSAVILFCCAFLEAVCFSLNYGWVKYIDHNENGRKCVLISCLVSLIKRKAETNRENDYEMPTVNNASDKRHDTDVPIQNFSPF